MVCPECATPIVETLSPEQIRAWRAPRIRPALFGLAAVNLAMIAIAGWFIWTRAMDVPPPRAVLAVSLLSAAILQAASAWLWRWIGRAMHTPGSVAILWVLGFAAAGLLALFGAGLTPDPRRAGMLVVLLTCGIMVVRGLLELLAFASIAKPAFPERLRFHEILLWPWFLSPLLMAVWPPLALTGWVAYSAMLVAAAVRLKRQAP